MKKLWSLLVLVNMLFDCYIRETEFAIRFPDMNFIIHNNELSCNTCIVPL